jgi:gas vesicle protein
MKFKTLSASLIATALLATSVPTVFAQSPTPSPSPSSTPTTRRGYLMQVKENRQEVKEEAKARIQEKVGAVRAEAIEAMAERVEERFNRHEERLNNWIERAQKHIDKKEADGADMTAAQTALDAAKTDLAEAVVLGDAAVAKIKALTADNWSQQGDEVLAARAAVKEAHLAFVKTIQSFRQTLKTLKAE